MATLAKLTEAKSDYVLYYIAVLGPLVAIAAACAWGLKRLRQRTRAETISSLLVKHLGGYTRELVTTASGKRLHFYECEGSRAC